jgi:elongation factor P
MKASEVKRGNVVQHEGKTWQVRDVQRSAPTGRGGNTTYRFALYQVGSGAKLDLSLRAEDDLEEVDLIRRAANFSYMDDENYVFLDADAPYTITPAQAPDLQFYLTENQEGYQVLLVDEQPLALQFPQQVELCIVDTPPYLRGASATGRTKTARLQTGLEVQVPEFIENGERVRISTETGEYVGRAA